jgi:hypothetical protein
MSTAGIIVAITVTVVCVIVIRTYACVVIVPRSSPVMTMRSLNVAPVISIGQRMNVHVIIGIKRNV